MGKRGWFELSEEGWQRLAAGRPLGRLLLEAVQNAFDAGAGSVSVELHAETLIIEDDALAGVEDERLVYTVFLTNKAETAEPRGRFGRGLKELLAAMDEATVETIGKTTDFTDAGRFTRSSERARGTRLTLRRPSSEEELRAAEALLRLCIAPKGTILRVSGRAERAVRRPRLVLSLPSCELETVDASGGLVRAVMGTTTVSLYAPRRGDQPHIFELGVPIEAWEVPWHVDVGQRVPLGGGRDTVRESFKLALGATLLEAMIRSYMDRRDLRADWVQHVIARWPVRASVLDAYVSKLFPRGAVLAGTARANDRARQLGAHIVDVTTHGAHAALGRVLETADDYVRRRAREFTGEDVEPDEVHERFAASVRWLARRIAGRVVGVRFFARDAADDGLLEDARTDVDARVLFFNVRGPLRFDDVLDPATLGVVLHELAHLDAAEHDHRFLDRLQHLAGGTVRLFAEGGADLAVRLRRGDPDTADGMR